MVYTIKRNSISNYPNPQINCNVLCFLKQEDAADESKAVYWIPFQISLVECTEKKMTAEQIQTYIEQQGKEKFEASEMQTILQAVEFGASLNLNSTNATT